MLLKFDEILNAAVMLAVTAVALGSLLTFNENHPTPQRTAHLQEDWEYPCFRHSKHAEP